MTKKRRYSDAALTISGLEEGEIPCPSLAGFQILYSDVSCLARTIEDSRPDSTGNGLCDTSCRW